MHLNLLYIILIIALCFPSCRSERNSDYKNTIWEDFKKALENKNTSFLIENSLDSIKCIDCVEGQNEKLQFNKFIFQNHLKQLYNVGLLKEKEYSNYITDSMIRINYSFKDLTINESYSIIYMFDKVNNKYLFTGMITVP